MAEKIFTKEGQKNDPKEKRWMDNRIEARFQWKFNSSVDNRRKWKLRVLSIGYLKDAQ